MPDHGPDDPLAPAPPRRRRFGHFDVQGPLPRDPLGVRLRAVDTLFSRTAAIVVLDPALRDVPGQRERLEREAPLLVGLDHPHVLGLIEYADEGDADEDSPWLAYQDRDVVSLAAIIASQGPLPEENAFGVVHDIATGLTRLHYRGLLQREVSPQRIVVDPQGASLLCGVGILSAAPGSDLPGDPAFRSPEGTRGEELTPASDIYSVGALAHFLVTGRSPHTAEGPAQLDGEVGLLVQRCLSEDRAHRPADAAEFLAELELALSLDAEGVTAPADPAPPSAVTATPPPADTPAQDLLVAPVISAPLVAAEPPPPVSAPSPPPEDAPADPLVAAEPALAPDPAPATVSETPPTSAPASSAPRRLRPLRVMAAALAVLIVGAAIVFGLTRGDDADSSDDAIEGTDGTPAPDGESPTDQPTDAPLDPVVASVPEGQWLVRTRVASSNNTAYGREGRPAAPARTWTFRTECSNALTCGGRITSDSGTTFAFTWNGTSMVVRREPSRFSGEVPCVDPETGDRVPDSSSFLVQTYSYDVFTMRGRLDSETGKPKRFVGTGTETWKYSRFRGACTPETITATGARNPRVTTRFEVIFQPADRQPSTNSGNPGSEG